MKKAQRWFPLLSITWLLSAALAAAGDPAAPPGMSAKDFGPPWKVWYGVYGPDGTKMGAASAAFSQGSDPANPVYKLELSASITAITMERSQVLEFDGKPPFALRKGSAKFTQGAISKLVDLAGSAEGLEATITEGGKPRTKKIPGEYALGDALAAAHWLRQQERKPGEKFISRELDLLEIKVEEVTLTVRALKQTQSHAVQLAYYELGYDSSIHGDMGVVNTGRDGQPLTTKLAGQFDLRSEPEGLAKLAEYRSPFCLEILAKLDRPMGNLKAAGGAVLEATGEAAAKIPAGTRQAVAFNEQTNTTELKLGAAHSAPAKATPEEIQEHLKASPAYPIREAQVSTLAKQAVGDAKTEQEKVERLVVFCRGLPVRSLLALGRERRGNHLLQERRLRPARPALHHPCARGWPGRAGSLRAGLPGRQAPRFRRARVERGRRRRNLDAGGSDVEGGGCEHGPHPPGARGERPGARAGSGGEAGIQIA